MVYISLQYSKPSCFVSFCNARQDTCEKKKERKKEKAKKMKAPRDTILGHPETLARIQDKMSGPQVPRA